MSTKKIATFLKFLFILAVVGGLGYQCLSSGYTHYETQAESGLDIPENATDINVYRAITTWYCFDFKTDLESYKKWVKDFTRVKLSEISQSNTQIISYSKAQDKLLYRQGIEHYRASWNFEDQGINLIFVPEEGRAYYSAHSR